MQLANWRQSNFGAPILFSSILAVETAPVEEDRSEKKRN
jgi:hypothetical protein